MVVFLQNPFDNLPHEGRRKQRYWLMAEAFARAGHRVVYFTSDFSHADKAKRRFTAAVESDRIELRLLPTLPYARNVSLARVRSHRAYAAEFERAALAEPESPQVIISSVPTLAGARAAIRVARRRGARVVIDIQDAWPETFERLAPRGWRYLAHLALWPLRRLAHWLYREADLVTGVAERYRALAGRDDYYRAYLGVER